MKPREYIKDLLGIEITEDNESYDCDLSYTMIEDLMLSYVNDSLLKIGISDDLIKLIHLGRKLREEGLSSFELTRYEKLKDWFIKMYL